MLETINSMIGNIPTAVIAALLAGLLRSVAGYIENVYRDGKDQKYELRVLLGTVIQYFAYIMFLMLGLPAGEAIAGAFAIDAGTSALKKIGK